MNAVTAAISRVLGVDHPTGFSSATIVPPSEKQIAALSSFGVTAVPASRGEATAIITAAIAARDMKPASAAQIGKALALGGRDLPGVCNREASTAITLLEALSMLDTAETSEQRKDAVKLLVDRVRLRYQKVGGVAKPATIVQKASSPVDVEDSPF